MLRIFNITSNNYDEKINVLWVVKPWLPTDVSKECSVTFFMVKESKKSSLYLD
jgi:hypothetical protein